MSEGQLNHESRWQAISKGILIA